MFGGASFGSCRGPCWRHNVAVVDPFETRDLSSPPPRPAGPSPLPSAEPVSPADYQTAHLANVTAALFDAALPSAIGPYQIKSVIGKGGMGIVYLAEQAEPIRRTVALKVIKVGMDTEQVIARFESERQAVARMNHPNVARVLDAGATETGRPYFVMEYVAGQTITAYADTHRLTVRQRLELFIQACRAVEHAHQKAIIHRDLKPSNILVTTASPGEPGVVKVIDFGLAKAIGSGLSGGVAITEAGQMLGTPEYMSPEQADLGSVDIDTRTDVYSLGVVLYELLAGVLPFDPQSLRSGGLLQVQRIIREVEPPSPADGLSRLGPEADDVAEKRRVPLRSLSLTLNGEIEWVIRKALRKERSERYATATELADDVRRYLDHQPLRAGPDSLGYRARKFLRRNRGTVAAGGLVAAALVAGAIGTSWQAVRATRAQTGLETALGVVRQQKSEVDASNQNLRIAQRDLTSALAEVRRQKAEVDSANAGLSAVNRFLTEDLLQSADPGQARGDQLTVREALDIASADIDRRFADQPAVEASIRYTLAVTYDALGEAEAGLPHARRSLEIRRKTLGDAHPDTVASLNAVVTVLQSLGRTDEAETLSREALERARPLAAGHPQVLVTALSNAAAAEEARGRHAEAERLLREALLTTRKAFGDEHPATLTAINNVATMLTATARPADAEPLLREVIATNRRLFGDDHPDTLLARCNLARALQDQKKPAEAETLIRDALGRLRKVLGDNHPAVFSQMRNLGSTLEDQERYDEAVQLYRPALAALRKRYGDDHPETITAANHLASLLLATGQVQEAATVNRQVLASCRRQLGEGHPFTIMSMNNLGIALWKLEQFAEAEPLFAEAYRRAPRSELDDTRKAFCMSRWGPSLVKLGRHRDAEAPLLEAHRRLSAEGLEKTEPMLNVLAALVKVSEAAGRPEEAAKWRAAVEAIRSKE